MYKTVKDLLLATTALTPLGHGGRGVVFDLADKRFDDFVFKAEASRVGIDLVGAIDSINTYINAGGYFPDVKIDFSPIDYKLDLKYGPPIVSSNIGHTSEGKFSFLKKIKGGEKLNDIATSFKKLDLEYKDYGKKYNEHMASFGQDKFDNFIKEYKSIISVGHMPDPAGSNVFLKDGEFLPFDNTLKEGFNHVFRIDTEFSYVAKIFSAQYCESINPVAKKILDAYINNDIKIRDNNVTNIYSDLIYQYDFSEKEAQKYMDKFAKMERFGFEYTHPKTEITELSKVKLDSSPDKLLEQLNKTSELLSR